MRTLILFLLACACAKPAPQEPAASPRPAPASEVDTLLDAWLSAHADGLEIVVDAGALRVHCPIGIHCDENFDYWAVKGGEPNVYISFEPGVLSRFDREGLQDALSYVNVRYRVELGPDWDVAINPFSPFRVEDGGMTVESYEGGILALTIEQPITHLYGAKTGDARCRPPADGAMPPGCAVSRSDLALPVTIRIRLPIPSTGLDCTDGMSNPACG